MNALFLSYKSFVSDSNLSLSLTDDAWCDLYLFRHGLEWWPLHSPLISCSHIMQCEGGLLVRMLLWSRTCTTISLGKVLIHHSLKHFLQSFRWGRHHSFEHPILRLLQFALYFILSTAVWTQPHISKWPTSCLHREKTVHLVRTSGMPRMTLPLSITGCLPPPWCPGPVHTLCL